MSLATHSRWTVLLIPVAACHLVAVGDVDIASCEDAPGVSLPDPPAAPSAWEGPFFVVEADDDFAEPPLCPGGLTEVGGVLGNGADIEGAMAHDCGCALPPEACRVEVVLRNNCNGVANETTLVPANGCVAVAGDQYDRAQRQLNPVNVACETTFDPVSVRWRTQARRCAPRLLDVSGTCSDTRPGNVAVCISQPGVLDCPESGRYQDRRVFDQKLEDRRACQCGRAEGECDIRVALFNGFANCDGDRIGVYTLGNSECTSIPGVFTYAKQGSKLSVPTCSAGDGGIVGDVESSQPITLCCVP